MKARRATPIIVGWNELVDLPAWSVYDLPAKIDTGARSSSLHVESLEVIDDGGRVRFLVEDRRSGVHSPVTAEVVRRARVTSSTGHRSQRIFVSTTLVLGEHQRQVEVNLVNRGDMNYRMLVGRSALAGAYLVDPRRRRLTRRPKKPRNE